MTNLPTTSRSEPPAPPRGTPYPLPTPSRGNPHEIRMFAFVLLQFVLHRVVLHHAVLQRCNGRRGVAAVVCGVRYQMCAHLPGYRVPDRVHPAHRGVLRAHGCASARGITTRAQQGHLLNHNKNIYTALNIQATFANIALYAPCSVVLYMRHVM